METAYDPQLNFSDTKLDLSRATSLPSHVYTSQAIYERELERIFYKKWMAICHASRLRNSGDVVIRNIGKKSILIVKGDDGKLRAFHNVCRHRGARLMGGSKNVKAIQCPYHAWTYKLDGTLIGCPDMDTYADSSFQKDDYPLYPVKLEMWGGFVWINLDSDSQSLRSYLGDFTDRFEKYRTEELEWVTTVGTYDVACNWKVMLENFNECYHCPAVHPETLKPFYRDFKPFDHTKIRGPYVMLHWRDCAWEGQPANVAAEQMTSSNTLGLSDEESRTQWLPLIFPNFQFTFTPDWVMTLVTWPEGPQKTKLAIELYSYKWSASADFSEMVKLQDFVTHQDIDICEVQQAGLDSGVFDGCKFNAMEENIHTFQKLYADAIGQPDV